MHQVSYKLVQKMQLSTANFFYNLWLNGIECTSEREKEPVNNTDLNSKI